MGQTADQPEFVDANRHPSFFSKKEFIDAFVLLFDCVKAIKNVFVFKM